MIDLLSNDLKEYNIELGKRHILVELKIQRQKKKRSSFHRILEYYLQWDIGMNIEKI